MRKIMFRTGECDPFSSFTNHVSTVKAINNLDEGLIVTTCLHLISFDLLDRFDKIFLVHKGVIHELKLGQNGWTTKELRKEHNLLKLVTANILNKYI